METTVDKFMADTDNRFSWDRVVRIGEFYFPALRMQVILYPVVALVLYGLTLLGHYTFGNTIGILSGGLSSTALSFMFYFAPVVLTRRDARIVETMLPATTAEKSVFMLGYFMVVIPVLSFGVYYGVGAALQWIFSLDDVLLASVQMTGMAYTPLLWACNLMSAIVPAITCLWAVMVVARSRALMGMVWSVVSLISLSVLSGLITLTLMYVNGFFDGIMDNPSITESPEAMTAMSMETVTMVAVTVGVIGLVYNVFAVWRVWRVQSCRQL